MKIKLLLFSFFLAVLTGCSDVADNKLENPEFNLFNKLKITQIRPHGWIKTFLERQKEGLTGNIEVAEIGRAHV